MTAAQILHGHRGSAQHEELAGIAVGYDEDGKLTTAFAGIDQLGPPQRRKLADELEQVAAAIRAGQTTPLQ